MLHFVPGQIDIGPGNDAPACLPRLESSSMKHVLRAVVVIGAFAPAIRDTWLADRRARQLTGRGVLAATTFGQRFQDSRERSAFHLIQRERGAVVMACVVPINVPAANRTCTVGVRALQ